MELTTEKLRKYGKRLMLSRMRLLNRQGFYGLLLMHMKFAIDEECETAATDGESIYFGAGFLETLSDKELDTVMMHEILHIALQHLVRGKNFEAERYNIACDIVINSNILLSENMNLSAITINNKELMHLTPNCEEGYKYTAEAIYEMLPVCEKKENGKNGISGKKMGTDGYSRNVYVVDDHSRWDAFEEDELFHDVWLKRVNDAATAIEIREKSQNCGSVPLCVARLLKELRKPQTDWRTILNEFVQEEVTDYSFSPPDRRYDESLFFLPDYNEKEDFVSDILFMIDTSSSMNDEMVGAAYSEVKGAIDQFNGMLCGWLGFFDASVVEPKPFEDEESFKIIKPKGGGGTNFHIIFDYVEKHMRENRPTAIIIMTDGYAPFPEQEKSLGIPVLWLLVNEDVNPPWGKVTRVSV